MTRASYVTPFASWSHDRRASSDTLRLDQDASSHAGYHDARDTPPSYREHGRFELTSSRRIVPGVDALRLSVLACTPPGHASQPSHDQHRGYPLWKPHSQARRSSRSLSQRLPRRSLHRPNPTLATTRVETRTRGRARARQPRAPVVASNPYGGRLVDASLRTARSRGRPPKPSAARLTMRGAHASRRTNPPPASPTNARPSRPSPSPSQSPSPSPRTGQGPGPGQGRERRCALRPRLQKPRPRPNRTLARWRSDFSRRPPVAEDTVRSGAPWDGAATETGASSCTTRIAEDRIRKREPSQ